MGETKAAAATVVMMMMMVEVVVVGLTTTTTTTRTGIGVNWGTLSSHKMSPKTVVDLLSLNRIRKVKLFDADPQVLSALVDSRNIDEVIVGIPNDLLEPLSTSTANSDLWVQKNLSLYYNNYLHNNNNNNNKKDKDKAKSKPNIRYVAVGNEPFLSSYSGQYQSYVIPALTNLQQSLTNANLASFVKLVVPCNADAYEADLPSQGAFRPELTQIMTQLVSFLNSNGSPFVVNIYPFLSLYGNSDFPQDYAFFGGTNHAVTDGPNVYTNAFDGNYDTLVSALTRIGYSQMPIVIGEVGWPTDGAIGANITAAKAFNQGLINHVLLSNQGTPLRPGVPPVDIYLFALLDEGGKSVLPGNFERHWGIFSFDGQAKYPLNLELGGGFLKNAENVEYLPSRWCVANPSKDLSTVASHIRIACSEADCTTLGYGGSCNAIGAKGNISYAFNSYYQLQKQNSKSCDYDGLGMITFLDPSVGECRFLVGVIDTTSSTLRLRNVSVVVWIWILWGFWIFIV